MAGAGFKDFTVGEVLTASDVNTYLMQQSVMRFADAAARDSALGTAIGTAVPLSEGMVAYDADAEVASLYAGGVWSPLGLLVGGTSIAVPTSPTTTTATTVIGSAISYTPLDSDSVLEVSWEGVVSVNRAASNPRIRDTNLEIQELEDDGITWSVVAQLFAGLELIGASTATAGPVIPFRISVLLPASRTNFTGTRSYRARVVPSGQPNIEVFVGSSAIASPALGRRLSVREFRLPELLP
jgi:hypothetical protein